jgi:hypothetical protein
MFWSLAAAMMLNFRCHVYLSYSMFNHAAAANHAMIFVMHDEGKIFMCTFGTKDAMNLGGNLIMFPFLVLYSAPLANFLQSKGEQM